MNNAIVSPTEGGIVTACYSIEKSATGPFCGRIFRNPLDGSLVGGNETGVDARSLNSAVYQAKGVDFRVAYTFEVGAMGDVNLDLNGTRVLKSIQQDATFLPANNCRGLAGDTCLRPDPKWRRSQTTQWNYDALSLQLRWQYLSKVTHDSIVLAGNAPTNFQVPVIGDRHYFDLTGSYAINDNVSLRAGVKNLLDKGPPVVGNDYGGTTENSGNTYPATYDPLGRSFFFGATANF